jgi:hypothetical protein
VRPIRAHAIIKEIVLKDMRVAQVPRNNDIKIGDRVPDEVQCRNFPVRT